jgi:hypothetical protein
MEDKKDDCEKGRGFWVKMKPFVDRGDGVLFSGMTDPGCYGNIVFCDGVNNPQGAMEIYAERTKTGYNVRLAIMDGCEIDACKSALDVVVDLVDKSFLVKGN